MIVFPNGLEKKILTGPTSAPPLSWAGVLKKALKKGIAITGAYGGAWKILKCLSKKPGGL
ncbi:hypothetical protein D9M68_561830 [compost metagenome]